MRYIKVLLLSGLLVSCSSSNEKESFLSHANSTTPSDLVSLMDEGDKATFTKKFFSILPKPSENNIWIANGYVPSENLKLETGNNSYDTVNVGEDPKQGLHLTSTPISADGLLFTLGGQGEVQARLVADPSKLVWEKIIDQENLSQKKHGFLRSVTGIFYDSERFLGGNICYSSGVVFATTKRGNIYALSGKTGEILWTKKITIPIRSAPIASAGKLIITTIENKTYALNSKNGKTIWIHEGLGEKSKLATSPAPLIHKGKIILTYSSGEVYQLNLENGKEVWSAITSPSFIKILNPSINDIGFTPVYHKGRVFITTSDGRIVALDYATGNTLFEFEGYSISRPVWAAADSIFAVTKYGKLVAISITTGELVWEVALAEPEDIHDDKILFSAPIMADGALYIANNKGVLVTYSPKDGSLLSEKDISSGVILPPIVVKGKMFMITSDEPKLVYFR